MSEPQTVRVESMPAQRDIEIFSRGLLKKLLLPAAIAVLAYGLLLFYADADAIIRHVGDVAPRVLFVGTALACGNFVVRYFRWQFYLRRLELDIETGDSVLIFLSGFAMSITPGKLGEVIKALLLKESYDIPVARTAPIVMAERVTDLAGLLILAAIGLAAVPGGLPIAVLACLSVLFLFGICTWRPLGNAVLSLIARVPRAAPLMTKLRGAYDALTELTQPWPFTVAVLNSVIAWGLQCVSLNVFAWGFPGVTLTVEHGFLAYSAPLLAGTLALIPGGLGVTEATMTGALEQLGGEHLTPSIAAAITILSRLSSFWLAIIIGFVALGMWRAKRRGAQG